MSEGALRREPAPRISVGTPLLARGASRVLGRALAHIEGGTLVVRLPGGRVERFGSGPESEIAIHDMRAIRRIALSPRLGLGEAYQAGEWSSPDLPALLYLLARNADRGAARHPHLRRFAYARPRVNRRTGLIAARRNISYHYDLGNDLFALFLDETMTYSCAVFDHPNEPLVDAQHRKLRMVCDALALGPDDHVLEIGCGWGSFALTAAREYGARVTGITLSREQAELVRRRVSEAGLDDRIEIRVEDFRETQGRYTKVASIEMIEAIGEQLLPPFFATIDRVLEPGGRACIQSILVPDARFRSYRSSPDWIERYVFPGCLIPSLGALREAAGTLRIAESSRIGPHYADTLARWRAAFMENLDEVARQGFDARFVRTWDFYLAACEALFRSGLMDNAQLVVTR